jgi:hypothetical protein
MARVFWDVAPPSALPENFFYSCVALSQGLLVPDLAFSYPVHKKINLPVRSWKKLLLAIFTPLLIIVIALTGFCMQSTMTRSTEGYQVIFLVRSSITLSYDMMSKNGCVSAICTKGVLF